MKTRKKTFIGSLFMSLITTIGLFIGNLLIGIDNFVFTFCFGVSITFIAFFFLFYFKPCFNPLWKIENKDKHINWTEIKKAFTPRMKAMYFVLGVFWSVTGYLSLSTMYTLYWYSYVVTIQMVIGFIIVEIIFLITVLKFILKLFHDYILKVVKEENKMKTELKEAGA